MPAQNWQQLITNSISQFLGISVDISICFFEPIPPKLSSVARINQFHVQKQLFIRSSHFSGDDKPDTQVFSHSTRVDVFLAVVLNGAVRQNLHSGCPRDDVDEHFDDPLTEKLHLSIGRFGRKRQYRNRTRFSPWRSSRLARFLRNVDESVSPSRDGFNVMRIAGRVPQGLSKLVYCFVETLFKVHKGVRAPKALPDLLSRS